MLHINSPRLEARVQRNLSTIIGVPGGCGWLLPVGGNGGHLGLSEFRGVGFEDSILCTGNLTAYKKRRGPQVLGVPLFSEACYPRLRREHLKPTTDNHIGSSPLDAENTLTVDNHIGSSPPGAGNMSSFYYLAGVERGHTGHQSTNSAQHLSVTTGAGQRRRKSTPRVERICITAFSSPR